MTTELRYLGSYGYRIQQAHGPCDPLTGPRIDGPHRARYQYHRHNRHTTQRYKVRTDNITVRTTMRPHRYLQVLVPDSACTWPMHPTTAPWGEGPHQLRYKYHTQNRDTYEPRTDTHKPHTGLRDCSPVDSSPVPTSTRLGILTVDASLHPPPRVDGPHRPHNYSTTHIIDMRTR